MKEKNKYIFYVVLSILTICLSVGGSYFVVTTYSGNDSTKTIKTITDYSNVTITETGLSVPVAKVYDSVVVVETYVNNRLYATGTGFVFKEDDNYGYILTNHHVIEDGTSFKVIFTDDNEVEVEVVGSDEYSDIAVLKVDKKYVLSVASLGSSSDMSVGDTTFAIGAPVDASTYSWTVTRGILSGKDRVVEVNNVIMNVLQTDTAINSGNSGGPLCNANGEVIGVINMKLSSSQVEGMGFAIPIEVAIEYANNFINGDAIVRPYLGVSMYDLSSSLFSREDGIYLKSVEKDSPAAKAGLEAGDIIIKIDDKEVSTTAYLKYELYKHNVGDEVTITYKRNGEEHTTTVTLGSYDIRG
ncbi:MAG: trypsin-like peptidase domain-containing protein [Bacilli bacterium]|nr:trypsin-like peptidase domain-containing protein [Bacilli bacterium]